MLCCVVRGVALGDVRGDGGVGVLGLVMVKLVVVRLLVVMVLVATLLVSRRRLGGRGCRHSLLPTGWAVQTRCRIACSGIAPR